MKTFVRTLLLILLAAAIILGTAWYLLEYDRDFTHDLLLEGARFFEMKDMHEISTWLYDAAYKYGTNIDEISLELADYYQSVGNFAKVEEALTRAIKDGGGGYRASPRPQQPQTKAEELDDFYRMAAEWAAEGNDV